MSRALAGRLARVAAKIPPAPVPGEPTPEETAALDALPTEELMARWSARAAAWAESEAGRAWAQELAAMSDEQLLDAWNRKGR